MYILPLFTHPKPFVDGTQKEKFRRMSKLLFYIHKVMRVGLLWDNNNKKKP